MSKSIPDLRRTVYLPPDLFWRLTQRADREDMRLQPFIVIVLQARLDANPPSERAKPVYPDPFSAASTR